MERLPLVGLDRAGVEDLMVAVDQVDLRVGRSGTVVPMDEREVLTAAELEKLPVDERRRLVDESIVTDLSTLDPEHVARIRTRGRELLEARGIDVPPAE